MRDKGSNQGANREGTARRSDERADAVDASVDPIHERRRQDERREDDRFGNAGPAALVLLDEKGRPQPAVRLEAEDISSGGLRVRCRQMIHPGSTGAIQILGSDGGPMMAGVRAAWCQYVGRMEHLAGFEFQPIPSGIKPADFVDERGRPVELRDPTPTPKADPASHAPRPVRAIEDEAKTPRDSQGGVSPKHMPIGDEIDDEDNRRSAPRFRYGGWCALVLLESTGIRRPPTVLQAVDLSAGGLALRSPWMAHTGTIGAVQMLKADGTTTIRGVRVQWCKYHSQMEHLLGMKFVPLDLMIKEDDFKDEQGRFVLLDPKYAGGLLRKKSA